MHDATGQGIDPRVIDAAIAWHMRQVEMDAADWAAFTEWLETDPAHADAYGMIAAQDTLLDDVAFPAALPVAANDDAPRTRRWLPWLAGSAMAAGLAAWLVPGFLPSTGTTRVYATRDGERRDVRLPDGTVLALAGGTRVHFDGADARAVTLDRGQVTLSVVHDAAHPFTVEAAGQTIQDVGTTFDVTRSEGAVTVAVAEGSVVFQPTGAAVSLKAGEALAMRISDGAIVRSRVAPAAVGGWRSGMLDFDGVPLSDVAASLRRLYGTQVTIAGDLSKRPFTGMIRLTGTADRDIPHLADLIGATWRRDGERWVLAGRDDTPH
ncbi:MAG: FecR domain-containing protein [Sphingomonas phyllosphaerae]|uniref:FecR family protein n=1 Tax=Sphingomonas phyllosphaerae TaxID=257003 RepID=UPI002FFB0ABD